jgi:hypothetical protein
MTGERRPPLLIHGIEEFSIVLRRLHFFQKKFHALHRVHRLKDFSQEPNAVEIVLVKEQFFFSSAGALNVNGGKDPAIDQTTV